MDIQTLTEFFMWMTIIGFTLLLISTLTVWKLGDFLYSLHGNWFNISREDFNRIAYAYLGMFKVAFLFLSLIPYVALLIIA